ncbi:LPS export ABC transporter permease LptF [Dongia deserti]|uniref:LPS export ABC transporter permease LptF n=1 Tax=Dongia deserti TaxID=2268030 RepID=UPI000E65E81F|nr:LPS export ABC transporter permease LptF [Dongia deserti]
MFKLSLIDRYMLKRVCWPLAGAIVIGMAALLLERLIRLLDLFANRGGPLTLILKMLGNLVPHYLAIAIPAAFFVGILYATLRLSNDSELDVMRASGLSLRRLAAPMLVMAVVLTVASAIILGFLQPYTRYAYRALVYLVTETSWNSAIERGAFFSGFGGKTILIGDIADGGRTLRRIFIQETDEKGNNIALSAQTGELRNDPRTFSLTLVLRDGVRVDSKPDGTGGKASTFKESSLPLEVVAPEPFRENRKESELSLLQLVRAHVEKWPGVDREDVLAEINYRVVRTLTVLFLPLLAIPMGLTSRRQPTSIRIVVGIAILIIYYQLLQFGKDMAENARMSSFLALWVPFFVFALGSTYMFHVANSRLNQDPFAVLFGSIEDCSRWIKGRWASLFRRKRTA